MQDQTRLKGLKNIFRSLWYKNFRLFFLGQSISLIGTWIQRIALPWLVYKLTGSVVLLGVVGFAGQIPTFIISPFAGVLTDRWNRYHILMLTQVLAMVQAFILVFLFYTGMLEVWHIIALNVVLGCINAFDIPSRQSLFVEMLDNKEDLSNAIALNSSMVNGARLLGPSIAGILITTSGEGVCFVINAVSYLFVLFSLLKIKLAKREIKYSEKKILTELKEGFSYTFGYMPIKAIILLLALAGLMGMPYTVLMPVFAKEILHGNAHTFGFLIGASGFGALVGAFYLASRKSVIGLESLVPLSAGLFGIGLIAFSVSRIFSLSIALMVIIGLGMMLQMASSNTILQTLADDEKRGRVLSFYTMAFMGIAPFGSLLSSFLAKLVGVPATLLIGGVACIIGAIVFASKLKEIKKIVLPVFTKQNGFTGR